MFKLKNGSRRMLVLAVSVMTAATLFAGGQPEPEDDGVLRIVATTTQASDLARILIEGAESVEVVGLMGAGVDPHLYQPTEGDVQAMNAADLVVYSGLHLEGQFDAVFEALGEQGTVIYALSESVEQAGFLVSAFDETTGSDGGEDPHFWFDPRNWMLTTTGLAELLVEIDPDQAAVYQDYAADYLSRLETLYQWANAGMRSVPQGQRYLVTSHDAFQYFGAAFGWRVAAIQGISTEDEAGVGDVQDTVDFVIDNKIPVLFVESSIPPDTIGAVIEAIEAANGTARLGVRELYSDAMGQPGTFGGTYIGMIAENVLTILQSYGEAGEMVEIPVWPQALDLVPPAYVLEGRGR